MIIKKTSIKIPIYCGKLTIYLVDNLSDLNKKYYLNAKDTYGSFCFENNLKDGEKEYNIVLKRNTPNSVIVHETVHLVNYIFEYNGVQLDLKNDETQAYLTGYVFELIEKFLKKNDINR